MNEYCPKGFYVLGGVRGLKRRPLTPHPSPPLSRRINKRVDGCRSLKDDKSSSASLRSDGDRHHSEW